MPSNQDTKNDPHDTLEIAPDVVLVARAAAEFPSLAPDTASQPFNRQPNMGNMGAAPDLTAAPKVDATFRASDVNDIPGARLGGRWLRTASMAFMFALISVIATAAWQRYGNEAQAMMATGFPPRIDLASWLPWQKSDAAAPADTSTSSPAPATVATAADQAATSAPAAAQPADNAAAATTATPATAAPAAAVSPQAPPAQDPTQALQSMSRDVASLTQQIETLKASIAELKANQEQLAHEISKPRETRPVEARVSERSAERRPAKLGAPPRPLGTIVQRNARPPMYPPSQAAAAPLPPPGYGSAPVAITPVPPPAASDASDDGVVVRPPMPVR
jgi:hypothetical protein